MDVKLDSLQTVIIVLTCLVPGFILYSTCSLFTMRRTEIKELLFLRFVAFTALNFIVCLAWVRLVLAPHFIQNHPWKTVHYLIWIIFGCPILLGLIVAFIDHWQLPRLVTRLFGLQPMHSIPTAWDFCFNQLARRGPRCVIVTFKDGKQVGGVFAFPAVASSDASERDIYLIDTHSLTKDAEGNINWISQLGNDGILIRGDEVRSFEFLHPTNPPKKQLFVFLNRGRYVAKSIRQELEKRIGVVRWTGSMARTARGHIQRVNHKRHNFISEIDRKLDEEKNGIRKA